MRVFRSTMMIVMMTMSFVLGGLASGGEPPAHAQTKADKSFAAVLTDAQGVETEVRNVVYYWEEKISETSFIPHELRHMPVKRGAATVNIKFDTIKQIDVKAGGDKAPAALTITLTNGKTGEFAAAIAGSFRGESDFGQVDVPLSTVAKVILK
jgi:ABC-type phosphate transport system substrate-binding protein